MSFAAQDRIIKEIKRERGWREVNEVAKAPTKFNCDPFGEHMFNVTLVVSSPCHHVEVVLIAELILFCW